MFSPQRTLLARGKDGGREWWVVLDVWAAPRDETEAQAQLTRMAEYGEFPQEVRNTYVMAGSSHYFVRSFVDGTESLVMWSAFTQDQGVPQDLTTAAVSLDRGDDSPERLVVGQVTRAACQVTCTWKDGTSTVAELALENTRHRANAGIQLRRRHPGRLVGQPRPGTSCAAVAALRDPAYYRDRRQPHPRACATRLAVGLAALDQALVVEESVANFLNVTLPPGGPSAARLVRECRRHDVYLRDLSPLSPAYQGRTVRIAVRDTAENTRILVACGAALTALREGPAAPGSTLAPAAPGTVPAPDPVGSVSAHVPVGGTAR
ncbi:hypothetical protein SGLAM104S_07067 [Streptomyces glaucescens]